MNLKKLKDQIEWFLQNDEDTRNSDIKLTIKVWQKYHGVGDTIRVEQLYDLPNQDNIKRVRAKFNQEGKYWPTSWEVAKARGIKQDEWEDFLGYLRRPPRLF